MPDNRKDLNNSAYIKSKNKNQRNNPTRSRGLFDLPDGSNKQGTSTHKTASRGLFDLPSGYKPPETKQKPVGFGDLPSGEGKREKIEAQRRFAEERELKRKGKLEIKTDGAGKKLYPNENTVVYAKSGTPDANVNLEKDTSRSPRDTARFYIKEIGYYLKPIVIYFAATMIFVLFGALGKLNGIDLRYPCCIMYGIVMVLGGVFVNRHMSFSGFVIMAIINTLGAVLGHTGVVYNLPIALRRLVTLMNTPYFVFDSGDIKYDSVILLLSVVCPIILVYIGSRFHKFLYFLRSKRPKNKAKNTKNVNNN